MLLAVQSCSVVEAVLHPSLHKCCISHIIVAYLRLVGAWFVICLQDHIKIAHE